jgi:hypothetical protein
MSNNYGTPGLGNPGAFQVSGVPFATSSAQNEITQTPVRISFPYVTSWLLLKNIDATTGHDLRVGFSQNGVLTSGNYFLLEGGTNAKTFTPAIDVKCTEIWIMANSSNACAYSLIAGLTHIPTQEIYQNWSGSVGVG